MDPNDFEFYVERSDLYLQIGELENCISDLKSALEKKPENTFINYKLGLAFYLTKEYTKAIFYLENSLKYSPKKNHKKDIFYHLGNSNILNYKKIF